MCILLSDIYIYDTHAPDDRSDLYKNLLTQMARTFQNTYAIQWIDDLTQIQLRNLYVKLSTIPMLLPFKSILDEGLGSVPIDLIATTHKNLEAIFRMKNALNLGLW